MPAPVYDAIPPVEGVEAMLATGSRDARRRLVRRARRRTAVAILAEVGRVAASAALALALLMLGAGVGFVVALLAKAG